MSHILHYLFLTPLLAFMLLTQPITAKEMTQQERNKMTKKFVPIFVDSIILIVLLDDGDSKTPPSSGSPLKKTGQTISYYPGDDGDLQMGVTPSYSRVANGVVRDNITGLQWQDNIEAETIEKEWLDAQTYCNALSLDGGGWRLPTVQELQSIVVDGAYDPSIDTTAFVNHTISSLCWSSTTVAYNTDNAWVVYFGDGYTYKYSKSRTYNVRCVR